MLLGAVEASSPAREQGEEEMRRVVVLLMAMGVILLLVGSVALAAVLQGTDGSDGLNGTEESDMINGYGGNDTILGMSGNDVMFGGRGNDDLDSTPSAPEGVEAPGKDIYFGATGDDNIASFADEIVSTGRVRDHVRDYVFCGAGSDTVYADKKDFVASDCERVFR